MAEINPEAEKYLSQKLSEKIPYQVTIFNTKFIINDVNAYPPGKITEMFISYLVENSLIKGKVIVDIGAGCFALGIIAAKEGAKIIIGTDVSDYAVRCAKDNLALNKITTPTYLFQGEGLAPLLPRFIGKVDIVVAGVPWDSISKSEFERVPLNRQQLSRAFYDVDDELINDLMQHGFELLSPKGMLFITSSMRTINRIERFCQKYKLGYKIVRAADLHNDGNMHYILEITRNKS